MYKIIRPQYINDKWQTKIHKAEKTKKRKIKLVKNKKLDVDNFEVGLLRKSYYFHPLVEQIINKIEQDKEKEKEELDSTDGVFATTKSSVEKLTAFCEKEIDDLNVPKCDKIALTTRSKFCQLYQAKSTISLKKSRKS